MRADVYLTENGYTQSRQRARAIIESGGVLIDGICITKPSQQISEGEHEVSLSDPLIYVGRGGLKLEAAIKAFGVQTNGIRALDIGASTGGFTDCLLQNGAREVWAVDAGEGQLAQKLREDPRVHVREHLNARDMTPDDIGGSLFDLIVMDVSFISATYLIPRFSAFLTPSGSAICLIKPQFEVGKAMLGRGGVVKDRAAHLFAVNRVCESARENGLCPIGLIPSPISGGDGNLEFLVHLEPTHTTKEALTADRIRAVVKGVNERC